MIPETLFERGLSAALAIIDSIRVDVQKAARNAENLNPAQLLNRVRVVIARYEPLFARTLRDSLLNAWLTPARKLTAGLGKSDRGLPPVRPPLIANAGEPRPVVRFPMIEKAVEDLTRRRIMLPEDFRALDQDAQRTAFTVARLQSLESIERVKKALTDDVGHGGTLRSFRREASEAIGDALTPGQVETVYRTQVAQAYSAGQRAVLDHPMVADEFPYMLWTATHDSRTRPEHLAMEKHGQNGTAVYRSDDPMWNTLFPPAAYNCRCAAIPLSLVDAAGYGSREARRWLQTGIPPANPVYAARPYPIIPPPGWPTSNRIGSIP